jgi:hypothetical protein
MKSLFSLFPVVCFSAFLVYLPVFAGDREEALLQLQRDPEPNFDLSDFRKPLAYLSDSHPSDDEVRSVILTWYASIPRRITELALREGEKRRQQLNLPSNSRLPSIVEASIEIEEREWQKIPELEALVLRFFPMDLAFSSAFFRNIMEIPWSTDAGQNLVRALIRQIYSRDKVVPGLTLDEATLAALYLDDSPPLFSIVRSLLLERLKEGGELHRSELETLGAILSMQDAYGASAVDLAIHTITLRPLTVFPDEISLPSLIRAVPSLVDSIGRIPPEKYLQLLALRLREKLLSKEIDLPTAMECLGGLMSKPGLTFRP